MYKQTEKSKQRFMSANGQSGNTVSNSVAHKQDKQEKKNRFVDNRQNNILQNKVNNIIHEDPINNIFKSVGGGKKTIQRSIENITLKDTDEDNNNASIEFFKIYDNAVNLAYQYVVSVPSLGVYSTLNGYTKWWVSKWTEFLHGGRPNLMAAAFGYVVESLVCDTNSGFHPSPPTGYSVDNQFVSGSTRPDLALRRHSGSMHIAWLDLTASASTDHIFTKDNWNLKVNNFAEVTYPSVSPATLSLMVQNKDNQGAISHDEFEKRMAIAREEYAKRKSEWLAIGKHFQKRNFGVSVLGNKISQSLNPDKLMEFIGGKLCEYFHLDEMPDHKMIPSILAAMGVNSTSWGYGTGYSVSEKAGESWLVDNDTGLKISDAQ